MSAYEGSKLTASRDGREGPSTGLRQCRDTFNRPHGPGNQQLGNTITQGSDAVTHTPATLNHEDIVGRWRSLPLDGAGADRGRQGWSLFGVIPVGIFIGHS